MEVNLSFSLTHNQTMDYLNSGNKVDKGGDKDR